jgi:cytochrome c2
MRLVPRLQAHLALAFGVLVSAAVAAYGCSSGSHDAPQKIVDAGADGIVLIVDASSFDASRFDASGLDAQQDAAVDAGPPSASGPSESGAPLPAQLSGTDAGDGQQVFRFETFGNEGFWTRVAELPQGLAANSTTPAQALALGLSIDIDRVPAGLASTILSQIADAGKTADPNAVPALVDPATTTALLEANAVLGLVARNVTAPNGQIDINTTDVFAGEAVGISCAFCHSITDGSVLSMASGGSIGHRVDGPTNHNLQVGQIFALANHSLALYPMLGLHLVSNGDSAITRQGPFLQLLPQAGEVQIDSYLNDPMLYPVGMFDDQPDGNGAPVHIQPLFRQDLAAPYGSEGSFHALENFANFKYTTLFDPTDLLITTPAPNAPTDAGAAAAAFSGPQYLEFEKLGAAGLEILTNYKNIIENVLGIPAFANGNNGYPFVGRKGECVIGPAGVENEASELGLACNQARLLDLNSYLFSLRPPPGIKSDAASIAAGRLLFRQQCTQCHNDDQSLPVPQDIVPLNSRVDLYSNAPLRPALYPAWLGALVESRPGPPFAPLVPAKNYLAGIFDDKLIFTEASNHGQPRGSALPLLMDLARKPAFLHDDEVAATNPSDSLGLLMDPSRGSTAPHPFFVTDMTQRQTIVKFLQSLDDTPLAP